MKEFLNGEVGNIKKKEEMDKLREESRELRNKIEIDSVSGPLSLGPCYFLSVRMISISKLSTGLNY